MVLNLDHLLLDVANLSFFSLVLLGHIVDFLLEVGTGSGLFGVGHFAELLVSFDFLLNVLVLLLNHVDVGVEHVHVVVKGVVLFLSLDESSDDFLNRRDAGLFFNLLKSVFNNLDIADVHVHQVLLLKVVSLPASKSGLKQSGGVRKLSGLELLSFVLSGALGGAAEATLLLGVVTLSKFSLKSLDFLLEVNFVSFVLLFQSENLVVGLLADTCALVRSIVQLLDVVNVSSDFAIEALVNASLVTLLLAPDVDFLAQILVR